MPRIVRIEEANYPYHVIQRGNRRQKVFFKEEDKSVYLEILRIQTKFYGVEIWAYCLMNNHVHLILCPRGRRTLTMCVGEAHRQYTRMINFREGWRGHLWQGRFKSFPLDDKYLFAAVRYVERNPVRAKIVTKAEDYKFSSAGVHVLGRKDELLSQFYLLDEIKDWGKYLQEENEEQIKQIRINQETGRPRPNPLRP